MGPQTLVQDDFCVVGGGVAQLRGSNSTLRAIKLREGWGTGRRYDKMQLQVL